MTSPAAAAAATEAVPVAVAAEGLGMTFGDRRALEDLHIEVRQGEVFGLLGHNGAGKTTTVRLLTGLLEPTAGAARVFGLNPLEHGPQVRARCGVSTETPSLDERMTGRAALTYFAELYDLPRVNARARIENLLDEFDLVDAADERIGAYSKGMKQRLALARAVLHDPALLFLDEPTSGLDPVAAHEVEERVRRMSREQGKTVLLCTHNLRQAQGLCDRVAVLERGRPIAMGTPRELARGLASGNRVTIEVAPEDVGRVRTLLGDRLAPADGGEPARLEVNVGSREEIPLLVSHLAAEGLRIFAVEPHEPTLEDVYFALHARAAGEAG